ncbi:MAG TPA: TlpA disulfide reductase family protein, partial [Puia sp.]|nr:TlpA disulfide reductase family protein [Puia sp.]
MTKKLVSFLIGMCVTFSGVRAQGIDIDGGHLGLQVGDSLPSMVLEYVLNVRGGKIDTRELRGKYLILDFWDIHCGSCIDAFPRMEHLQRLFPDQLRIVLVGPQTEAELKKHPVVFGKLPSLAAVTGDTILHRLFPHQVVPHHVWIDRTGRVIAITDGLNSDSSHVARLLKGEKVVVSSKRPIGFRRYDRLISLFRLPIRPRYYSLLFGAMPDHQTFGFPGVDSATGRVNTYTFYNYSILELYKAWLDHDRPGSPFYRKNRIIVDSAIRDMVSYPGYNDAMADQLEAKYTFSYEISVEPKAADSLFAFIGADLNRFFAVNYGIHGGIETKRMRSLVISIADRSKLNKDTGRERQFFGHDTAYAVADYPCDVALSTIAVRLQDLPMPVVDNTGYHGKITLTVRRD